MRRVALSVSETLSAGRLILFAAGLLACGVSDSPHPRPLVLLLTVDTLRPDYLGAYGYDRESSPFLDALLARGLVFDRAVTPVPRTTPALASLFTGQYPHTHGVRSLLDRLDDSHPSLAVAAADAGYATLAIVSNHILPKERGLDRGFSVYDTASDTRDARATTEAALAHVREHAESDKLFLWVHYIDPHTPYYSPPPYAQDMDPGYSGPYASHFGEVPGGVGDHAYPPELGKRGAVFQNYLPDAVNAHIRRLYAADIRYTDDAIAELFAGLEELRGSEWVVVFTSDHGESLGEHHFYYDHGDYVYQAGLAVPLALVLPRSDPMHRSGRVDARVSLVDIAPTLAELLGLSLAPPEGETVEGRSLLPALRGEKLTPTTVFAESGMSFYSEQIERRVRFDVSGRFRAAIDERWKLVFTPGRALHQAFELYDLANDPSERDNLYSPTHPEAVRLHADLIEWTREDSHEEMRQQKKVSPEDERRLKALGYIE